jgi:hypothetical protein
MDARLGERIPDVLEHMGFDDGAEQLHLYLLIASGGRLASATERSVGLEPRFRKRVDQIIVLARLGPGRVALGGWSFETVKPGRIEASVLS